MAGLLRLAGAARSLSLSRCALAPHPAPAPAHRKLAASVAAVVEDYWTEWEEEDARRHVSTLAAESDPTGEGARGVQWVVIGRPGPQKHAHATRLHTGPATLSLSSPSAPLPSPRLHTRPAALSRSSSSSSLSHHHRIRLQISLPPARSEVVAIVVTCKADVDVFFGRLLEAIRARASEVAPAAAAASGAPVVEAPRRQRRISRFGCPWLGSLVYCEWSRRRGTTLDRTCRMRSRISMPSWFQLPFAASVRLITMLKFYLNYHYYFVQSKAKEMMQLAEKMRLKLLTNSSAQLNSNDEDMGSKQDMQGWLLSVGIVSPVTKETAGALYHQQLSRQPCEH